MDDILRIEKKIFDPATIARLPFEFFNYIASVIVNPEIAEEIAIPQSAEDFFRVNKSKEAKELFNKVRQLNIAPDAKSFMESYINLIIFRYSEGFKIFGDFSLKRINTKEEYSMSSKMGIKPSDDIEIYFNINDLIPKFPNGAIDFEKLKIKESQNFDIAAFFSMITSIQVLDNVFWKSFTEITSYGFIHRTSMYEKELETLMSELNNKMLIYFAKMIYKSLTKDSVLNDVVENLKEYFTETSDPNLYYLPDELDELEVSLYSQIRTNLDAMTLLNKKTKDSVFNEFVQIIMEIIDTGLAFPQFYYKVDLREASEVDKTTYRIDYAADVYVLDELGKPITEKYESYAFVVAEDNMEEILKFTFNNDNLFNRFISLDK